MRSQWGRYNLPIYIYINLYYILYIYISIIYIYIIYIIYIYYIYIGGVYQPSFEDPQIPWISATRSIAASPSSPTGRVCATGRGRAAWRRSGSMAEVPIVSIQYLVGALEHVLFFHSVGNISSSQLTKSYVSEGLKPPTRYNYNSQMLHGAGIFTYKTGWFLGHMLTNIPAPWSIWELWVFRFQFPLFCGTLMILMYLFLTMETERKKNTLII